MTLGVEQPREGVSAFRSEIKRGKRGEKGIAEGQRDGKEEAPSGARSGEIPLRKTSKKRRGGREKFGGTTRAMESHDPSFEKAKEGKSRAEKKIRGR